MRWSMLLPLLFGCSLVNRLDPDLLDARSEICANGLDDNEDGLADCSDPQCFSDARCLAFIDLRRNVACASRPVFPAGDIRVDSTFARLDFPALMWRLFGYSGPAEPTFQLDARQVEYMLLSPPPTSERRGVELLRPIQIGLRNRLTLDVRFSWLLGAGDPAELPQNVFIVLEEVAQRLPIFSAQLAVFEGEPAQVRALSCRYRARPPGRPAASVALRQTSELRLEHNSTGELVLRLGVQGAEGVELCRTPATDRLEPPGQLFLSAEGSGPPVGLQAVSLVIEGVPTPATPTELMESARCRGAHEPLLAPDYCASEALTALSPLGRRVLQRRGDEGWYMLVERATGSIAALSSPDGIRGWTLLPAQTTAGLERHLRAFIPADRGFLVWTGDGQGTLRLSRWRPDAEPETVGRSTGETQLDTLVAVVEVRDRYLGWRVAEGGEGDTRCRLEQLESDDGLTWRDTGHTFGPGLPGEWHFEGVGCAFLDPRAANRDIAAGADIIRISGGFALAYVGERFPASAAIGLAVSADGIRWTQAVNNPVLVGSVEGHDAYSVTSPSLALVSSGLRIGYHAEGSSVGDAPFRSTACLRTGQTGTGGGPSAAVLEFPTQ